MCFSRNPVFQAAAVLFVLLVSFTVHEWLHPFLRPMSNAEKAAAVTAAGILATPAPAAELHDARMKRVSMLARGAPRDARTGAVRQVVDLNVLEGVMLRSCVVVLIGGLMFASGELGRDSSPLSVMLALVVGGVIVVASGLFVWMVGKETFVMMVAGRVEAFAKARSSSSLLGVSAREWKDNPLRQKQLL